MDHRKAIHQLQIMFLLQMGIDEYVVDEEMMEQVMMLRKVMLSTRKEVEQHDQTVMNHLPKMGKEVVELNSWQMRKKMTMTMMMMGM